MNARLAATHVGAVLVLAVLVVGTIASGPHLGQTLPETVLLLATLVTGWLIATRLPRNPVGWVLLWLSLALGLGPIAVLVGTAARAAAPALATWAFWYSGDSESSWTWVAPVMALLVWLPLHFPDGRLPSRRWRWFSVLTFVTVTYALLLFATGTRSFAGRPNPTWLPAVDRLQVPLLLLSSVLAVVSFVGAVTSLVVRYRHGGTTVRAQLRWMILAAAIAAALLVSGWLPGTGSYTDWIVAGYAVIPVAIAIAVLKYRLYEIDRIISRTASYLVVTLVVIGVYLGVVLLVSAVLHGPSGSTPPIAVAAATLAAATVFLPALRWVRRRVDQVFNRAQYDAERVVVAFGERIRNGADPHTAGPELVHAVEVSLDPSSIGLWVRP